MGESEQQKALDEWVARMMAKRPELPREVVDRIIARLPR